MSNREITLKLTEDKALFLKHLLELYRAENCMKLSKEILDDIDRITVDILESVMKAKVSMGYI